MILRADHVFDRERERLNLVYPLLKCISVFVSLNKALRFHSADKIAEQYLARKAKCLQM